MLCSQKLLRVFRAFFSDAGEKTRGKKNFVLSWPRLTICLVQISRWAFERKEKRCSFDKNDLDKTFLFCLEQRGWSSGEGNFVSSFKKL